MPTLTDILQIIRPKAQFVVYGPTLNEVRWDDAHQSMPTQAEVDAARSAWTLGNYKEFRTKEYPSVGDQLDAIWKGGAELDAMRAKVLTVKAKYPKP